MYCINFTVRSYHINKYERKKNKMTKKMLNYHTIVVCRTIRCCLNICQKYIRVCVLLDCCVMPKSNGIIFCPTFFFFNRKNRS